ncbi:hypothetical protein CRUP_015675, partial [Coryphaenoides rupestris]
MATRDHRDPRDPPSTKISPFHGSAIGGRKARSSGSLRHTSIFEFYSSRQQLPFSMDDDTQDPAATRPGPHGPPPVENQSQDRDKVSAAQPSSVKQNQKASSKSQSVKRKKRKMGMYNLVPKKKTRVLKQAGKKDEEEEEGTATDTSLVPDTGSVEGDPASTLTPGPPSPLGQGPDGEEPRGIEYTELALDSLDLKAQEELLSPPLTVDADLGETDLAEELPLCCCRMETPPSRDGSSTGDQTCMAMESADGMVSRCQRRVLKQEMMRPSNTVHLLVLCEDHRAGMGSFLECRPYGSISHRFHRSCASVLKEHRFCPHCGENADSAREVTVPVSTRPSPNPRVTPGPRADPCPALLPAAAVSNATATASPFYHSPQSIDSHREAQGLDRGGGPRKDPMKTFLLSLDDESLKPEKGRYAARHLYLSAKEGDLPKTPLMCAAENNRIEAVRCLLVAGATISHK